MFNFFKKTKWNTVNVLRGEGLKATLVRFNQVYKVDAVIKVQEKEGDTNTIRCIVDTGFSTEQVSCEYVMGLFDINNIDDLTTFKVE